MVADDDFLLNGELYLMAIHATEYADVKLIMAHVTDTRLIVLFQAPSGIQSSTLKLPVHRSQYDAAQAHLNEKVESWASIEDDN